MHVYYKRHNPLSPLKSSPRSLRLPCIAYWMSSLECPVRWSQRPSRHQTAGKPRNWAWKFLTKCRKTSSKKLTIFILNSWNIPSLFFLKDVSSQGSSEDCWHISHHTYPTHIHSTRIPPIRIPPIRIHSIPIHSMRIHSKGLHQQEWQCMWMQNISLHIIASAGMAMYVNAKHILAYHCISRNGNECEYHCMSFHTIATRREWQWK